MVYRPLNGLTAIGPSVVLASVVLVAATSGPEKICAAAESAAAEESSAAGDAVASFRDSVEPILATYCYTCHADGETNGGVAFDGFKSPSELVGNRQLWWKVLKNVRAGIMPPAGEDRPTDEQRHRLEQWIKRQAFGIDPESPDPGRVTVRRLNREEYRNTIRDLMGIDFKAFEEFPPDDTGYGFDNIGDVLSVSPLLLEKYLQAAKTIVEEAVPKVSKLVREQTLAGRDFRNADDERLEQLTFYKEASVSKSFDAPQAGDYRLNVRMFVRGAFDFDPGRADVSVKLDGEERWREELKWEDNKRVEFQLAEKLAPGEHRVTIDLRPLTPIEEKKTSVDLRIDSVRIEGPLAEEHWVRPKNFERFFAKDAPADAEERRAYARDVLAGFARRAYRRPVDEETLARLVAIAEASYGEPGKTFEEGVGRAMIAVLASPRFIFRVEGEVAGSISPFAAVDEYALASRLSYFLWSTMPDEELFDLAERGELRANLPVQVKRMLGDSRANALVENFTGQWLQVRDVEGVQIDSRAVVFRDLDPNSEEFQQMQSFRRRFQQGNRPPAAGRRGAGKNDAKDGKDASPQRPREREASVDPSAREGKAAAEPAKREGEAPAEPQTTAAPPANVKQQPAAEAGKSAAEVARQLDNAKAPEAGKAAAGKRPQRPMFRRFRGPRVEFDRELRLAMRRETEMLFGHILRADRSVLDLIDSDYTFLNERLAQHYGIAGVTGREMRRVELPPDNPRGGVLTHGSVLTVTSNPTRTSPVKRGLFVLENIIGSPPPPPPDDIPDLEEAEKTFAGREPALREVLELHRKSALCSSCHSRMDPLGLALENFNALGMWREKERGQEIDAAGELITGESFKNVRDLKRVIRDNRRLDFYRCLTEKLLTYALGRGLEYYDVETVDQIIERLEKEDGRMSALIGGIVESAPFQKRRSNTAIAAIRK